MHKTLTSVVAFAGLVAAAGAVQAGDAVVAGDIAEPMELSLDQMDRLTAGGDFCFACYNYAVVVQNALAAASANGFYKAEAEAEAENEAEVEQQIN